jgi:hypothetical protein
MNAPVSGQTDVALQRADHQITQRNIANMPVFLISGDRPCPDSKMSGGGANEPQDCASWTVQSRPTQGLLAS